MRQSQCGSDLVLSLYAPHWGRNVPDCGPLNMRLDTCPYFKLSMDGHAYLSLMIHSLLLCDFGIDCAQVPTTSKKAREASKTERLQTRPIIRNAFGSISSLVNSSLSGVM